jgi:hypothetical protein
MKTLEITVTNDKKAWKMEYKRAWLVMEEKWLQHNLGHCFTCETVEWYATQEKSRKSGSAKTWQRGYELATKLRQLRLPIFGGMHYSYDLGLEARALLT